MIYTEENYRTFIFRTIKILQDLNVKLGTIAVNLLMLGELEEVSKSFEPGDTFEFRDEHFEGSNDDNLKIVNALRLKICKAIEELPDLNYISEFDLENWEEKDETWGDQFLDD
ncbi:MAG: hypothetical protein WBF83_12495 [Moheibacter sp.]